MSCSIVEAGHGDRACGPVRLVGCVSVVYVRFCVMPYMHRRRGLAGYSLSGRVCVLTYLCFCNNSYYR